MSTNVPMRLAILMACLAAATGPAAAEGPAKPTSVIFIHPDGAGLAHWGLGRVRWAGPDGNLAWDTLPAMALYRPHVRDSLAPESHSGGTIHAYGVKVPQESFGLDGTAIPETPAGDRTSLMRRAMAAGRSVGIANTGHLAEPGTACMLASVPSRSMTDAIVAQLVEARPSVLLGGGEAAFLPKGVQGRHGPGARADGRDLVAEAKAAGYHVVFTREELAAVPDGTRRLLGLFASSHTFHAATEEALAQRGLAPYASAAPTAAEMAEAALRILREDPNGFFLMLEEEGTDNHSNARNAAGMLEAVRRADEAIAVAERFRAAHPDTLVLVAADSCAASPQLIAMPESDGVVVTGKPLPATLPGDSTPIDGVRGPQSEPFVSAPDAAGRALPFAVAWASPLDGGDPVVVRAAGPGSELVRGNLDNTGIYRVLFQALFGETPEAARSRGEGAAARAPGAAPDSARPF